MTQPRSGSILVVISGSGSNLQAIIDSCAAGDIPASICAVVSNNPGVYGLERAEKAGIQSEVLNHRDFDSREAYDEKLAALINKNNPDLIVLAGFMRILTPEFVQKFKGKLLNIHPSLLPKYPGLHTHQRAIDNGDSRHGATVHFVTEELDGGPAIIQGAVDIEPKDDAASLATKVQEQVEYKIYPKAVEWFMRGKLRLTNDGAELEGKLLPDSGYEYTD